VLRRRAALGAGRGHGLLQQQLVQVVGGVGAGGGVGLRRDRLHGWLLVQALQQLLVDQVLR
jgi:hypothetical protein